MIRRTFGLVAAAAVLSAAAAIAMPSGPAGAAATHVGIVVRYANGSVSTACTTTGGTGYDVLRRKYDVYIGTSGPYAGFLLQINSQPSSPHPDNTHYWSYWHSSGSGSWTYSGSGAGSNTPKAGTVEGWSYVNGQATAPAPPAHSYASLCAASDPKPKPKPTPTPTHKATPKPTHHSAATAHSTAPASTAVAATSAANTTTLHSVSPAAATTARHPIVRPAPRVTSADAAPTSSAPADPSSTVGPGDPATASHAAAPPTQRASSGFPAWGTVLAIVVVLAIGAAAWLRTRRRTE
jgi:hypothetical protein